MPTTFAATIWHWKPLDNRPPPADCCARDRKSVKFHVMKAKLLLGFTLLIFPLSAYAQQPATMRLDYYHTGNINQEIFSLDRVVVEPLPWPGDMSKTIDTSGFGLYFFEV